MVYETLSTRKKRKWNVVDQQKERINPLQISTPIKTNKKGQRL